MYFDLSTTTWLLFITLCMLIYILVKGVIFKWKKINLREMFFSFYGFFIFGILFNFILRFIFHTINPQIFRATAYPLWDIPDIVFSYNLVFIIIFLLSVTAGYLFMTSIRYIPLNGFVNRLNIKYDYRNLNFLDLVTLIALFATLLGSGFLIILPRLVQTPVGYLASLFALPATYAWYWKFNKIDIGGRKYLYLLPGILQYSYLPYREQIIGIALCILIPYLLLKKDVKIKRFALVSILAFILLTYINYSYRDNIWGREKEQEKVSLTKWLTDPLTSPWVKAVSRFHGYDSFLLTTYSVPNVYSFQNRNVFCEVVESLFPRVLYFDKSKFFASRGQEFSETIWSLGLLESKISARIAPSMPGDLYFANGIWMLISGAFVWGMLIGLLGKWKSVSNPIVVAVLLSFFGIKIFAAVERDFVLVVSNLIQIIVVILLLYIFLKPKQV